MPQYFMCRYLAFSDVNILFTILVLLMQFRNILNDVETEREGGDEGRRKRRRKPQAEKNEVKDTTCVTGKIRKMLWF
jgi:hypothetical protein